MKSTTLRQRIVATAAGAVLAMGVMVAMPASAFATATTITAASANAVVTAGQTLDMSTYFSADGIDENQHIDYKITASSDNVNATVNKHSGVLTATNAGSVTVTAYLVNAAKANGVSSNPCQSTSIYATKTVTIDAAADSSYGYQGTGFQIKMLTPTVVETTASSSGYTNNLADQPANTTVTFTFEQNAGLNQYLNYYSTWGYSSPEAAYQALAGQYIRYSVNGYEDPNSDKRICNCEDVVKVTEVTSTTVTLQITLGAADTGSAGTTGGLHFESGLHTFKQSDTTQVNKELGVNVDFNFVVTDQSQKPVVEDLYGWQFIDGYYYYYIDEKPWTQALETEELPGGGVSTTTHRYYFDAEGRMLTGLQEVFEDIWVYLGDDGAMRTGWHKIDNKWYYFEEAGDMVTGWQKINGTYYYFGADGVMVTGWLKSGSSWYYLKSSGAMATGWQKIGSTYYYFKSSGAMQTGWLKSGTTYYYLKSSGAMATGWLKVSGSYYYFASSGKMYASKWLQSGGKWYWFKASGKMAASEILTISGKKYTFLASGALK